jgi:undecaprenyl-diphosphatase
MASGLRVAVRRVLVLPAWVRRIDARAGRAVNGRKTHPLADRFWSTVTGFADRGILWWTIAGVLAVTGRHRAAARGALSLLAASAIANLIAKQLFGGDRPVFEEIPIGRRLPKQPSTPAFPSGHSASAAAFAVGVGLEHPRLGAAIAPLSLGVGYSRLHVGAHWLSDVIGGLALGAAVAAVGGLLGRRRRVSGPLRPPGARPASRLVRSRRERERAAAEGAPGEDRMLPASPEGDGVFIVANPSSGTSVVRADPKRTIAERLPRAELHELADDETPGDILRAALERPEPPRILGVCGGDGTVAAAAQVAREAGLPLLVVPGGTFNHFARTAGAGSADLAIDAVQRGEGVRVDVGELAFEGQQPFTVTNTASVGVYPDFVAERERLQPRLGKWIAAVAAAGRVLARSQPVTVGIRGRRAEVWTLYAGIGANDAGVAAPLQRRTLDDGVLDVRILHAGSRARAAASLAFGRRTSAVFRRLRLLPERVEAFTTTELEVTVYPREGQPPGFAHDGEVAHEGPARAERATRGPGYRTRLRLVPGALDIYRPAATSAR